MLVLIAENINKAEQTNKNFQSNSLGFLISAECLEKKTANNLMRNDERHDQESLC
jgi:hypothetical protein